MKFCNDNIIIIHACTSPDSGCPIITSDLGTCQFECDVRGTTSEACPSGQLCCSNGCGTVCEDPVTVCVDSSGAERQVGMSFTAEDGCNTW